MRRIPTVLCGALASSFALSCAVSSKGLDVPDLRLGTAPSTPELFAPSRVSTPWRERDAALSRDGALWLHTILTAQGGTIVLRARRDGHWGALSIAPFSGEFDDIEPTFDPAGDRLWFASKRPKSTESEPGDWNLWHVDRDAAGLWSTAVVASELDEGRDEFYPSLTQGGELYFTANRGDSLGEEDIYKVATRGVGPARPENLGAAINSAGPEYNAFVAPDGSYLIYSAERDGDLGRGDLRVSFHLDDGSWTQSVNLGTDVNSAALDYCPFVSPDGSTLFFTSNRRLPPSAQQEAADAPPALLLRGPIVGSGDVYRVSIEVVMRHHPSRAGR